MALERAKVMEALRAEDVLDTLDIVPRRDQRWRGRWLRAPRCADTDHNSDAFAIARDGMWHCWSCDTGGGLLDLVARSHRLDCRQDFPQVLAAAAAIAGVDDDEPDMFAPAPPPKPQRPAPPPLMPWPQRLAQARRRAAWVWERLHDVSLLPAAYLRTRSLDPAIVCERTAIRTTPIRMDKPANDASQDAKTLWHTMGPRRGSLAIVVPVHSVVDGAMIDLRARRVEPEPGMPKVMGMVGGVTVEPEERGKARQLAGCYGYPHAVDSDLVVCCEGLFDYLTSLQLWPNAHVLGATEAGSLPLVVMLAARALAARDNESRLIVVEQADPPRTLKDGRVVAGAADQAVNEGPNAALKNAIRLMRNPARIGWLYCHEPDPMGIGDVLHDELEGKAAKDLNDLVRVGVNPIELVAWYQDRSAELPSDLG